MTMGGRVGEVQEFCYLDDVLNCEDEVERALQSRVTAA